MSDPSSKTDRILAFVGLGLTVALILLFFRSDAFFDWAFDRHQNTASWLVRPLLLLPLCYSAWRRTAAGVSFSLLAILSSMFWFPAPPEARPDVAAFLEMERAVLRGGWTTSNILGLIAILSYGVAIVTAFWLRSWRVGFAVALAGAAIKIAWSLAASPDAGQAVVPYGVGGALVLALAIFLLRRRMR
ncbi:MAG: hypothetical protein KJ755_13345 [Alphaproteobacteria bacterium]|nr:hypothetical protein [Alphaproteobacteria bacterium]